MIHSYENIIRLENLFLAWEEFIIGKKKKQDVLDFSRRLMDNTVELHKALVNRTYRHGGYESFYINDPKRRHIPDQGIIWLLDNIIDSFQTPEKPGVGLPLGNLTSQLFVNVYLNQLDQWIKHRLGLHYYIRYVDDFVLMSRDKFRLEDAVPKIQEFLWINLKLILHSDKLFINTVASGMDFLGWIHFVRHRVLRSKTKERMFRNIRRTISEQGLTSYLGLISHGNTAKLRERVIGEYWLWQ